MSLRKNISDAVREAKDLKGYTYDEITEGANCSKSTLKYVLNGCDKVSLNTLESIIKFLGYDFGIILIEDDSEGDLE